jgi:hypothetical protein
LLSITASANTCWRCIYGFGTPTCKAWAFGGCDCVVEEGTCQESGFCDGDYEDCGGNPGIVTGADDSIKAAQIEGWRGPWVQASNFEDQLAKASPVLAELLRTQRNMALKPIRKCEAFSIKRGIFIFNDVGFSWTGQMEENNEVLHYTLTGLNAPDDVALKAAHETYDSGPSDLFITKTSWKVIDREGNKVASGPFTF